MKILYTILLSAFFTATVSAQLQTWIHKSGAVMQLELMKTSEKDGVLTGEFKMENGNAAFIKASDLSAADAARLKEFKPSTPSTPAAAGSATAAPTSIYAKVLDGNLKRLSGKSLKTCKDATKPTKYYLFYYTASWCGPCHKFTPSLVDFYNKYKPASDEFEVILITSDDNENDMDEYAAEFKMPWPQLKLSDTDKFKKTYMHPGSGIPNLVLTDLQGNLIKTSYEGENYVGPTSVMTHLASLLGK